MSALDRRLFLARAGGIAGALAVPSALQGLVACNQPRVRRVGLGEGGYGPLRPHPDCPELAVPEGFHCVKLSTAGDAMEGGLTVPNAFDGMAAFAGPGGSIRLVRNHEMRDSPGRFTPGGDDSRKYDPLGPGGTTTVEVRVNPDGSRVKAREFLSLGGTIVNCAGGPTPWGSWLTCEETTAGTARGWRQEHGYVFEVPSGTNEQAMAAPLKALGRFVHEAAAVDRRTGVVYLTEDQDIEGGKGAGFYRFLPTRRGDLAAGRLQMLAVRGQRNYNTGTGQRAGAALPVSWVSIEDPDPARAATDSSAVFRQGWSRGAAVFQRLEGCWSGEGAIYFNATAGGDAGAGQVWRYRPTAPDAGELSLIFESPSSEVLDSPDNIVVTPRSGLLLCEDGDGEQFVRGLTPQGEIFDFARNAGDQTEFAGACFSPDGQTFFVNTQGETQHRRDGSYGLLGKTYAIWGPWDRGAL
jgi:uncharacterized protein